MNHAAQPGECVEFPFGISEHTPLSVKAVSGNRHEHGHALVITDTNGAPLVRIGLGRDGYAVDVAPTIAS